MAAAAAAAPRGLTARWIPQSAWKTLFSIPMISREVFPAERHAACVGALEALRPRRRDSGLEAPLPCANSEPRRWRKRSCIVFSAAACLQERLSAGRRRLIHFAFVCKSLILFVSFPFSCCVIPRVNPRSACVGGKAANVSVASSWLSLRPRCHARSLQINTLGMSSDREDAPPRKTVPVAAAAAAWTLKASLAGSGSASFLGVPDPLPGRNPKA